MTTPVAPAQAPPLSVALIPIAFLLISMAGTILVLEQDPQIPLIASAVVAALVARLHGHSWEALEKGMVRGIEVGVKPILILMVIGLLIATWIASGVVPLLIFYGLDLLRAGIFLPAACAICAVVSLATGSSWTTAGTVGVALMGVGGGIGMPLPMVAGAIVSGAYFGDKMSPLSDSTNLAPAVTGVELFAHIRHMASTTAPAFGIALVLYTLCGWYVGADATSPTAIQAIQEVLREQYTLHPLLLIAPALVIALSALRVSALPALLAATGAGALFAILLQGVAVGDVLELAHYGYISSAGHSEVDALLSRGGLDSMMYAVSLILCALAFGGILEKARMIESVAAAILRRVRTNGGLVTATVTTCIGMNVAAPDQYLAIIVPGRMYQKAYTDRGLDSKNLSRTLEDAGTLTSPLVPWNTCGAAMMQALAISPLAYLPFAFFNLLTPLVAVAWGYLDIAQAPLPKAVPDETEAPES